jgi:hypothetical protein
MVERMSEVAQWQAVAAVAAAAPLWPIDSFVSSEAEQIDALVALQRLQAWADAQQLRLLAAMAAPDSDDLSRELVAAEVGCALRLAPATVDAKLREATELRHRLPATLALLETGEITARHASVLAEAVAALADELAAAVEQRVLERAPQQTVAAFRRSVQRAVLAVDPRSADERHRAKMADRRVCVRPIPDGMAEFWALLPADGAATLIATLNAMAAGRIAGDERTADQRRADALVELASGALTGALPTQHGRRPAVGVIVAASTLLGIDDEPGELDGYGPIPAAMARALAFDPTGTWRRLVTEPATGRLLDYGTSTYRPPQDLTDFVIARDRRCRFPGCNRPARRCHIDHQTPYPDGPTAACNCECLCAHHHRLKHESGWTVVGDPAEELLWTSPTVHQYRSPPGEYATPRAAPAAGPEGGAGPEGAAGPEGGAGPEWRPASEAGPAPAPTEDPPPF